MLWTLIRRYRWRVGATLGLVLAEALIDLLFPLAIGVAINGLLDESVAGLVVLGALGVLALVVGSARRFFDTRAYAGIYETVAAETTDQQRRLGAPTSAIVARTNLLREFVEFLENTLPQLIGSAVTVVGTLGIIAALDLSVFVGCVALLGLIVATYVVTGPTNYGYNARYNDELEAQVDKLSGTDRRAVDGHFRELMRWNRKLSDLETVNYGVIWLGVIALLVYAPLAIIEPGQTEYGFAFSAIVYVFQYVEAIALLERRPLVAQASLERAGADGQLAGGGVHRRHAGREQLEQGGPHALGGRRLRFQLGQATAQIGFEPLPHRLVRGQEGPLGVGGVERDRLGRRRLHGTPQVGAVGLGIGRRLGHRRPRRCHLVAGPEPSERHPEDHLRQAKRRRRRQPVGPAIGQVQFVVVGLDVDANGTDQRLVGGDPVGGDAEVPAAQRGEDRRVERLDRDGPAQGDRQVRIAQLGLQGRPEGEVLVGAEHHRAAPQQVGGKSGPAQEPDPIDPEVGQHHLHGRIHREVGGAHEGDGTTPRPSAH
ncbi:MAG: ABC transporter six-transmembrane domain-containing protein [Actinomycetota bacterium]